MITSKLLLVTFARSGNVFDPLDEVGIGYTFGIDPVGDMRAIQAAAVKAMNTFGGTLALRGRTYAVAENPDGLTFNTWVRNIGYGFNWTKGLIVEGDEATFVVPRMFNLPVGVTAFNLLHFGSGYDINVDPSYNSSMTQNQLDAMWHWSNGYVLRDLNIDTTVLTQSNLADLSNGVTGGIFEAAGVGDQYGDFAQSLLVENIHVIGSTFGVIGIGQNARSRNTVYRYILIDKVYKVGMWVDGPRNTLLDHITVSDAWSGITNQSGLGFESNTDCFRGALDSSIQNSVVNKTNIGLALEGVNCQLLNNTINMDIVGLSPIGIYSGTRANSNGIYPNTNCIIRGNTIQRPGGSSGYGYAFNFTGQSNAYGTAIVDSTDIENNIIGDATKKIQVAFNLGAYVNNTQFINNDITVSSGTPIVDASSGHSSGNVFSPNTFH